MRNLYRVFLIIFWIILGLCLSLKSVAAQVTGSSIAVILRIQGPLVPTHLDYLERGLELAIDRKAEVIILELDTPGGSIDLMTNIVKIMRSSRIPIVVYVSPRGAMAGSAGTIITLAGHLAAMAPETTIGAASPVGQQGEDIGKTMESKVKEMLKASIRSITTGRSKEAVQLAEETIESARAVTVGEALKAGLIDLEADDTNDLLEKLDGRKVGLDSNQVTLNTRQVRIEKVENTLIEQLLQMLTNPNILFLLLSIGVQAILIEISSPGGWVAGFLGATCLIVAFYGMGLLPVNWFGLLFFIIAFILFIMDIKAPTHGALTAAGAISFIVGALILFNSTRLPGFPAVSVPLVVGVGVFLAASFLAILTLALRAQKAPILVGRESIEGQVGVVIGQMDRRGQVRVAGETWSAEQVSGNTPLHDGEQVDVVGVDGLRLKVKKKSE